MLDRYFDHASTSPLDPRVFEAMRPWLTGLFGNANSIHEPGRRAMAAVDTAREQVAALIGSDPMQVIFTSGATESNNWVLSAFEEVAISPFEHSAIREPARHRGHTILANTGLTIEFPEYAFDLVSVMAMNNEIGSLWPAEEIRARISPDSLLHSDATQIIGKRPFDANLTDFASLSAHKFNGPQGVGALFYAGTPPEPLLRGGEQELGFRAGTLNVAGIVGMGMAAQLAGEEMEARAAHATHLRALFLEELEGVPDFAVNGGPNASPFILSVSFAGIQGETLVIEMDQAGYAISSGAACSSGSNERSHVLMALGVDETYLRGTVRISFGMANTPDSAQQNSRTMAQIVRKLRTLT
ncbi:MAG: cysteine desulfurase family protein [Fimbriimonas sp.]